MLVLGSAFGAGIAVASPTPAPVASATPTPTPTATPTPEARPAPGAITAPAALRTCSIAEALTDPRLAEFQGSVRNANSGEILFDRGGSQASRTASVMKVVTAAAGLAVLGPDYRVATSVVRGPDPGSVVLVGRGDITLASGSSNIYTDSASIRTLADQTRDAWQADPATAGTPISTVYVDSSYFSGPEWHPSWNTKERGDGYSSPVSALQVDGDRADPSANVSPRSEDPTGRAASAFVSALGTGAQIVPGTAPAGATPLAEVYSAPLSTMIPEMLLRSDNTEAEMIARITAITAGDGNSFDALATGIPSALAQYGLDTSGMFIADGSGLSDNNAVSPHFLTALMQKVVAREGNLSVIADGLPIAGQTGTLAGRFGGANADAAGKVIAKTGWIDTGYTLSGFLFAADGTPLTFAFFALGNVSDGAKEALDTVTTAAYRCGNSLSNN